ncbi:hypothetical protein LTR10_020197 [Elasticomyces elasticus]|uniref:Hexosyltransferase n=1 Tax=Exophiala sideris TaxID=1016849 RepID=A0ABR0JD24_9EURO|nr:hypothetical protein LTR10_020197 [Elasticomyces elasticus]KAK5031365.1 hypothetical protein LTS07_005100 [Exophiala sideris]KAK5039085.1 hypothetical protein LTR13_004116 [Exophiala sideris]KAK5060970.1 hypothetical protein LTR69_005569 [Exophiala sideris]KAK5183881.1 hypothetical protein LTR44_004163 [Eurotiomycetes sp. CCFEE 6388]
MRYPLRVAILFCLCSLSLFFYTLNRLPFSHKHLQDDKHTNSQEYAYVFYATNNVYACSAMINVHRLRNFFHTRHPIYLLVSRDVSSKYKAAFRERYDVTVIEHEPPPLPPSPSGSNYYRGVMLKLVSFKLHRWAPHVKRIIVMDADQLLLRSLDDVFTRVPEDIAISAARAYWAREDSVASTAMMMISPSESLWNRVDAALASLSADTDDMDFINTEFRGEMLLLPIQFLVLNSHWETGVVPKWSEYSQDSAVYDAGIIDPLTSIFYDDVYMLRFTALGKPWSYTVRSVHKLRPKAHPLFAEQFLLWRTAAKHVCPALGAEENGALDVVGKRYFYGAADLDQDMMVDPGSKVSDYFLDLI